MCECLAVIVAVDAQSQMDIEFGIGFLSGYVMSKDVARANQPMHRSVALSLRALSTVAYSCGFHFYTDVGHDTGVTATSFEEFAEKLQTISLDSVKFHFERADFQRWIRTIFCDAELAESIGLISEEYSEENLRQEIINRVKNHITKLKATS